MPARRGPYRFVRLLGTVFFTVLGNVYLLFGTLVCGITATVVGIVPPRGHWMFRVGRVWSWFLLWTSGVWVRRSFRVPLSPKQGYVFMANHQSLFDIPLMFTTLPGQTRLLAKKSLFQIPIFGWSLYSGEFIPVDRKRRETAREAFAAAVNRLRRGRSILLFPEETRSRDGELLPFKPGGFLMALKTGFPIVPVAIVGTRDVRPRGSYLNRPHVVEARFGEPIDPAEFGVRGRAQLTELVRERIAALLAGDLDPAETTP